MTPQKFLAQAAELDRLIQRQDRLIILAMAQQSRFLEPAVAVRNELVKSWAATWNTRQVSR